MNHHIVFLDDEGLGPTVTLPKLTFPHQWHSYGYTQPEQVVERLKNASIALTCSVPLRSEHLKQLPQLKMISLALTGTDLVDLDYCHQHGIMVTNVPAYAQNTVAEHIIGMMFSLMRQHHNYHNLLKKIAVGEAAAQNIYFDYKIRDVCGKRLGIIGHGAIAKRLAELATAIGMQVHFFDRNGQYYGEEFLSLQNILAESDVISICCPLTQETLNLIDQGEFEQMKRDVILINTARGGIINESALIHALQQQQIGGAALDVVVNEPIQAHDPLMQLIDYPNFILNPHVAWSSENAMQGLINRSIENIIDFARGAIPLSAIQQEVICQA